MDNLSKSYLWAILLVMTTSPQLSAAVWEHINIAKVKRETLSNLVILRLKCGKTSYSARLLKPLYLEVNQNISTFLANQGICLKPA